MPTFGNSDGAFADGRETIVSSLSSLPVFDGPHTPRDNKLKRVAIFGTSVNPPSLGHIRIVMNFATLKAADLRNGMEDGDDFPLLFNEIWIHPVFEHMFSEKKKLETFEHRMEMSRIAFEPLTSPLCKVRVLPTEKLLNEHVQKLEEPYRVGTVDVLRALRDKYGSGVQFDLILGSDTYVDLTNGKWKNWQEILTTTDIHVVDRPEITTKLLDQRKFSTTLIEAESRTKRYKVCGVEGISSSSIRNLPAPLFSAIISLDADKRGIECRYMLEEEAAMIGLSSEVLAYIRSNRLYFWSADKVLLRKRWLRVILCNIAASALFIFIKGSWR